MKKTKQNDELGKRFPAQSEALRARVDDRRVPFAIDFNAFECFIFGFVIDDGEGDVQRTEVSADEVPPQR